MENPAQCRILVVEDESLVRMMAVDMFEDAGFQVVETNSGEHALELLKSDDRIAGLFTDIELDGPMSGVALAHVVHGKHPDTAIIVVSGKATPLSESLPPNARFMPKPYDLAAVIRALHEMLGAD